MMTYIHEDLLPEPRKPVHWEVQYGRLQKRMVKLRQQRDHWKERTEFFNEMLRYYPYAKKSHEDWQRQMANMAELEALRKRVKEQELLIERLVNESK